MYANRAAEPLLSLWHAGLGQPVPQEWRSIVERVFQNQKSEALDVVLQSKVLSLLVVPVQEEVYVNVYGRDVTRERELDQLKSDFISMVSHQLRTPLTSMRWYSERLLKKGVTLPDDQKEMVRVIHHTSAQLASLIDDLLNLSRMERGTMIAEPVLTDMMELINEVVIEQRGAADKKHINFSFKPETEVPAFWFDKKLIREVLLNLASNAIKYTSEGGQVTIGVKQMGTEVLVSVSDTGMGITEVDKGRIFEKFFRSPKAVDSGIEGTGLGLSVAKLMVDKSGGSIWFDSVEGQGTTFSFKLPFKVG
jgi:signal transduction histidine kinase